MSNFTPPIELESSTFNMLNFTNFRQFLINNNVLTTAIGFVIASQLETLVNAIINNIVDPLLSQDINKDGKNDFTFELFGLKLGQMLYDILRFGIMMYIVFIISRFTIDALN